MLTADIGQQTSFASHESRLPVDHRDPSSENDMTDEPARRSGKVRGLVRRLIMDRALSAALLCAGHQVCPPRTPSTIEERRLAGSVRDCIARIGRAREAHAAHTAQGRA